MFPESPAIDFIDCIDISDNNARVPSRFATSRAATLANTGWPMCAGFLWLRTACCFKRGSCANSQTEIGLRIPANSPVRMLDRVEV